jgi:hypothetical protein
MFGQVCHTLSLFAVADIIKQVIVKVKSILGMQEKNWVKYNQ